MTQDRPAATIRDGALKASIWKNPSDKGDFYTTTVGRTYKDEQGQYRDSSSFSSNELLRVGELCRKSHDKILHLKREASRETTREANRERGR